MFGKIGLPTHHATLRVRLSKGDVVDLRVVSKGGQMGLAGVPAASEM